MVLKRLCLNGFRNYKKIVFEVDPFVNVFWGKNGQGKTNLLEGIYYTALTQSFKTNQDYECINYQYSRLFFDIQAVYQNSLKKEEKIQIFYEKQEGKVLRVNNQKRAPFSKHIGSIPIVLLKPDDIQLLYGSPSERRKFIDLILSQFSPLYLSTLIRYKRVIKQKNALLSEQNPNREILFSWNKQLLECAVIIIQKRKFLIEKLSCIVEENYNELSGNSSKVRLNYVTQVRKFDAIEEELQKRLEGQLETEILQRRAYVGVHRDDVQIYLNQKLIGKFGSQGENKTMLISLKLAAMTFLKSQKEEKPVLLFDDIFGELDQHRIKKVTHLLKGVGQVFITTTDRKRINGRGCKYFEIASGQAIEV